MIGHALIWVPVALVVAIAMDVWAGLLHGGVWHRWLWPVHRSHHTPRTGRWESNDALALFHAPPAMALILWGCASRESTLREIAFGVGLGMTLFALGYLVVHDGLVHGRLPVQQLARIRFLRGVMRAHRAHHTFAGPRDKRPYSLFFGPAELRRATRLKQHRARANGGPKDPSGTPDQDQARA